MLETLLPFDYQPLTRVVFGPGTLARLGEHTRELGGRRVLLVTDPGLEQAGHPQRAVGYLQEAGLHVTVFDHVEENPTTRHVEAGLAVAQNEGIDFLVAVGGGSAMDTAKGINFLLTNGGKMADYWGTGKAAKPMLPSIGVPTTAGTGSEAQSYALIANPDSHIKMACGDKKAAFRVAILDPELTVTQPQQVTADTGIDAISHALESYVTTKRNPFSQLCAREAWRLLARHFETVLKEPTNLEARAGMQLGAHLAGMAIENSMLGATHALANPLTAHYGLPHGQAIGLMLPHVIRFNAAAVDHLYGELVNGGGEEVAQRVSQFAQAAGLPRSLAECGVSRNILPVLAEEAQAQWTGRFNPRPVGHPELLSLYETALHEYNGLRQISVNGTVNMDSDNPALAHAALPVNSIAFDQEIALNRAAWERLRDDVRRTYQGQYVALVGGQVVQTAPTFEAVWGAIQSLRPSPQCFFIFRADEEPEFEPIYDLYVQFEA